MSDLKLDSHLIVLSKGIDEYSTAELMAKFNDATKPEPEEVVPAPKFPTVTVTICPLYVCEWRFTHPNPDVRRARETDHWNKYHAEGGRA